MPQVVPKPGKLTSGHRARTPGSSGRIQNLGIWSGGTDKFCEGNNDMLVGEIDLLWVVAIIVLTSWGITLQTRESQRVFSTRFSNC